jgi:hypothetical protein
MIQAVAYFRVRDAQLARHRDRSQRVGEVMRTEEREADPGPLPVDECSTQSLVLASPVAPSAPRPKENDPALDPFPEVRQEFLLLGKESRLAAVKTGKDPLLFFCNSLLRSQQAHMGRADIREQRRVRPDDLRQHAHLSGMVHPHLEYGIAMPASHGEAREGQPDLGVQVPFVHGGRRGPRQDGAQDFLGGRLAAGAGDADARDGGKPAHVEARQGLQPGQGVGNGNDRRSPAGRQTFPVAAAALHLALRDKESRRACRGRLPQELVSVGPFSR